MAEAFSEARIRRVQLGVQKSLIRRPSLAGCGGFNGSAMPPTPTLSRNFSKFSRSFCEVFADNAQILFLEMIDFVAAIDSVKKSSKSELSSRFFGRLKFWTANFRTDGRGGFAAAPPNRTLQPYSVSL